MQKLLKTKPWSSRLLASVFAPVFLGILIGGGGPSKPQSHAKSDLKIINKTKSIEVVGFKRAEPNLIVILLKNVSSVDMNGYELTVQDHARIRTDTSIGGWAISPGATDDFPIPEQYGLSEITILAAMFVDGGIEGDEATVKELKHWRSGIKEQLIRALPFLETALEAPDVSSPEVLDKLESEFSSLSLYSDDTESLAGSGLRSAKDELISDVRALRQRLEHQGGLNQQRRLLELKKRLQKRIASL